MKIFFIGLLLIAISFAIALCRQIIIAPSRKHLFTLLMLFAMFLVGLVMFQVGSAEMDFKKFHRGQIEIFYHSTNGIVTDTTYKVK